jgi:two-component system chemotaxis response regulator CheB
MTSAAPASPVARAPIRVFLVDDSAVALLLLQRLLATSAEIQVVGTARNGREALSLLAAARPDVIVTDFHMPEMDGLALVKRVMAEFPRPILVVSSVVEADKGAMFSLLAAGAVDFFAKPQGLEMFDQTAALLVQKVKILSGVPVIARRAETTARATAEGPAEATAKATASTPQVLALAPASTCGAPTAPPASTSAGASPGTSQSTWRSRLSSAAKVLGVATLPRRGFSGRVVSAAVIPRRAEGVRVVAIGASTGGPQTLREILGDLPGDFPCPILCVQHISAGFLGGLVEWLDEHCQLKVRIAPEGERAAPGTVYFPPEEKHLGIDAQYRITYSSAPAVGGHRPSATFLFGTLARHIGAPAAGVLLTGMGSDGAQGLAEMADVGAATIAQDEATSVVFGMPRQAIEMGAAQWILPAPEVAPALLRLAVARK